MKDKPLVSIALCTYNGQDFLKTQLDSILLQTFSDWEIVVVDDCSNDSTWEILENYAAGDRRFRLHRNENNLGYNRNFEKALRLCTGELIAICDQDDIWRADKLQSQIDNLGRHLLIYHDSELIDGQGKPMSLSISDKFNFYRGSRPEVFLYLNCVSGHTILMRREVLDDALPFPYDFHYDQWLAFVATSKGSIDFLEQKLVSYRQHDNNNTDLLALHARAKTADQRIGQLEREADWLFICSRLKGSQNALIEKLYLLCSQRNERFASLSYGATIWKNRRVLLHLLKKKDVSKFFYTLRKIWGAQAKMIA